VFIWAFVVAAAAVLPDSNGTRLTKVALAAAVVGVVLVLPSLLWTRLQERRHPPTAA
jgi:uncharacterized membrane protein YhhN